MTTITSEGRRIRSNIVTGIVSILAIMLALLVVSVFGSDDAVDGPVGSSFVTTSLGTAGLFETLDRLGADVVRSRRPLTGPTLEDVDTLLALEVGDAFYDPSERASIANAIEAGLTLVTAGAPNSDLIDGIVDEGPDWSPVTTELGTSTVGTATVVAPRFGAFEAGSGLPLIVAEDRQLAVVYTVGEGRLVMLSDTASLANQGLGLFDNARFVVGQIGLGRVVFDEFRHGFTEEGSTGLLDAAPDSWRSTGWLLLVSLAVSLVVYGRRFGPPEPRGRRFVPSRMQLVDTVATSLRRSGSPVAATEPTRARARREIRRRAMLGPDADDDELRAAAGGFLAPDEVKAIFDPEPDTVTTADRALARLIGRQPR